MDSGSQILLANTYHLLLRPGPEVFRKVGGYHGFTRWEKSVLTDSGGFQIFAMPNSRRMTEEGAEFLSYVDGKRILLTPELSIETQKAIGSDIMMVLDQCVPSTVEHKEAKQAMELTHRWALRSLHARGDSPQSLFAIVQGACYQDLRKASAEFLTRHPFDGFALGGLAVGESRAEREDTTEFAAALLPQKLPRYLMGVGTPIDLLEAVHRGMDMFDCILPTAMAQQGMAFTSKGKLSMRRGVYKFAEEALDPNCSCSTCRNFSRAYIHHLVKVKEFYGWHLIALHNIHFYHQLMREMREAILADTFGEYYKRMKPVLESSDEDNPVRAPKVRSEKKPPSSLGDYEVVFQDGYGSIRQKSSGETMHSVVEPETEARKLYLEQSSLLELGEGEKEIVLWDVGLGAATNVMAAIRAYESLAEQRAVAPLTIVSFENDLDSLRLAAQNLEYFKYLRHSAPHAILARGEWSSRKYPIQWKLLEGDFLKRYHEAPRPQIIFFDPFSYKTNGELWGLAALKELHAYCEGHEVEIFTYSSSTAVRATFLAAGFFVGRGVGTGPKNETTIAYTRQKALQRKDSLLGRDWLARWQRSDAKSPLGTALSEGLSAQIENHEQFQWS